jgi:hypothetical protein
LKTLKIRGKEVTVYPDSLKVYQQFVTFNIKNFDRNFNQFRPYKNISFADFDKSYLNFEKAKKPEERR